MKKILVATVLGATMAAPAAFAADTKVYGKFNIGLDHQKDEIGIDFAPGGGTAAPSWWRLRDNNDSSRLGFKGTEELGLADLKAIYQLEYGVDPFGTESAGTFVTSSTASEAGCAAVPCTITVTSKTSSAIRPFTERNIFVGLTGGFGTAKFGRYDTPIKEIGAAIDEFNDTPADITLLMAGETRASGLLSYATPKFADAIQLVLVGQPGDHRASRENTTKTENGVANTLYGALTYESPMLNAGVAYAKNETAGLRVDNSTFGAPAANQTAGMDIIRATVQGKFAGAEVGALYQTAKGINQTGGATAGGSAKDNSFLVSAGYTLEAFKFKAQAGQTKGTLTKDKRREYAVGTDYKLSKSMYTSVNLIRFDHTDGGATALPKLKTDTLNLSLTYSF